MANATTKPRKPARPPDVKRKDGIKGMLEDWCPARACTARAGRAPAQGAPPRLEGAQERKTGWVRPGHRREERHGSAALRGGLCCGSGGRRRGAAPLASGSCPFGPAPSRPSTHEQQSR